MIAVKFVFENRVDAGEPATRTFEITLKEESPTM